MSTNPPIHVSDLPDGQNPEVDFPASSFFQNHPGQCLPTPAEVRALSGKIRAGPQPPPVIFEHLNLLVKFGRYVTVAEAQCLYIIKKVLGNEVPVPELYGWRVDGHCVFIYMELIHGVTLRDQWDSMDISDKTSVCDQLSQIMTSLRRVEQDPNDIFIGSINRGRLLDMIFENEPPGGPFATHRTIS
ncbi:hypothetical protein EAF04_003199 [Stromatinia cepivora]|nr:hypothetical protein EAF04_003199 [Stromatinia cepivora]